MKLIAIAAATLAASALVTFAIAEPPKMSAPAKSMDATPSKDIIDTAISAGNFKTLAAALQAAGWVEPLKGKGPFTVFAPTDEAFAKLPPGTVEKLLKPENKAMLAAILTYHVVPGANDSRIVMGMTGATTVNGQRVDIKSTKDGVWVDNAKVTKTDIKCSNGIIHVIDTVIMPSDKDLIATAVAAGNFKTLAAALECAAWISTLQSEGPYTVLAPTDEAFAKLPAGTLDTLMIPENKAKLAAILQYHVIPGRIYAEDALKAKNETTVQGQPVMFATNQGVAWVNNARIIKTDIDATNGVIHIIDTVLMPKEWSCARAPRALAISRAGANAPAPGF